MQLNQKALHQTSEELVLGLQPLPLNNETKTSFYQFVRLADTVKFAKYLPPASEQQQSLNAARQMVLDVAQLKYSIPVTGKTLKN